MNDLASNPIDRKMAHAPRLFASRAGCCYLVLNAVLFGGWTGADGGGEEALLLRNTRYQ